ncbi:MAG: hypothetical protein QF911_02065 [Candidatus Thalassarchaeaceae archaeon]|jgi:hypothetical protein|nr:hypothetical protein [Candidatus Thalassarchaeaceae archaeon]
MPRTIHIDGPSDDLHLALEDRLLRAGAPVSKNPDEAEISLIIGGNSQYDIIIIANDDPTTNNNRSLIRLHDLIIPSAVSGWGTEVIREWVAAVKRNEEIDMESGTRYWVHVRDVVDAISVLTLSEGGIPSGEIDICGRRGWHCEDVLDEIRLLWTRFINSIHHSHTIESLSEITSPVKGDGSDKSLRPDLRPLHEALMASCGSGWHPLVQMRTSLMELIAQTD